MRIGLYGLPTAGKTYILNEIKNLEVLSGSSLLMEIEPGFRSLDEAGRKIAREQLAKSLRDKDKFIMDGHYAFGDNVVFTEADGELYDTFVYLYVSPEVLEMRMKDSVRNGKYLKYDLNTWQKFEVEQLRKYCHEHDKDFYVVDNPGKGYFGDISLVLRFIDAIVCGFSCKDYAKHIVEDILKNSSEANIVLLDGDKTLIKEDSSAITGYSTHLFDGNFYTGFQAWRHHAEMQDYLRYLDYSCPNIEDIQISINQQIIPETSNGVILTTGYCGIWKQISEKVGMTLYSGNQMAAETKYFVTKFLQKNNRRVKAYGDSMNDYYMLLQADESYLVTKENGEISRSLRNKQLEGIIIV